MLGFLWGRMLWEGCKSVWQGAAVLLVQGVQKVCALGGVWDDSAGAGVVVPSSAAF